MTERTSIDETATFYLTCIGLTIATWRISFTLGAYGQVFYPDLMVIWFVSIAALLAGLVIRRVGDKGLDLTWWGVLLLLMPTVVMTAAFWSEDVLAIKPLLPWLLLPSIPYIGFILFSVATPQATELQNPILVFWLVVILLLVNTLSYLVGSYNFAFLGCEDFIVAGDAPPNNCWAPDG